MTGSDVTRGSSPLEALTQTRAAATTPEISSTGAASTHAAAGADQARVSGAGALFAQSAGADDARLDKVAALQQAIAAGTYNVPSAAVADKLISALLR